MDGSSDVQPTETEESPPQSNLQDSQHGPAPSTSEGGLLKALDESAQEKPAPRPDQISQGSTSGAKRSFLLSKGLTDEEIDSAIEQAKNITPAALPAGSTPPAAPEAPPAPTAKSQTTVTNPQAAQVQPTPMGDLTASWTRITAAVMLVGFATVGVGSVAMPYVKKGWRWFMGTDQDAESSSSDSKKLAEVLDKQAQQQKELFEQVKDVASAVKTLQESHQQSSVDSKASAQLDALRTDVTALNAAVANSAPLAQSMAEKFTEIKSMLQRQTPSMSRQSSGHFRSPPSEATSARRSPHPDPIPSSAADRAAAAARPLFATPAGSPNISNLSSAAVLGSNGFNGSAQMYTPHSSPAVAFGSGSLNGSASLLTPTAQPKDGGNTINGHLHTEGSVASSQQMASNITNGSESEQPPHPPDFYNVLDMVSKGLTPAGVRSDIVDSPPDPARAPTPPQMARKPKPWEQSASSRTPDLQVRSPTSESGLGGPLMSDDSVLQGSSNTDREHGIHVRQAASDTASVGQRTPAVVLERQDEDISGLSGDKRPSIRAHAITSFTRDPSENLSEEAGD